jgi:hypothetical protein
VTWSGVLVHRATVLASTDSGDIDLDMQKLSVEPNLFHKITIYLFDRTKCDDNNEAKMYCRILKKSSKYFYSFLSCIRTYGTR